MRTGQPLSGDDVASSAQAVQYTEAPNTDVRFIVVSAGVDCETRIGRILQYPSNPRELLFLVHHQHPGGVASASWPMVHLDLELCRRGGHEFAYHTNF
jgi:hypothetical protein